jgi:hypothetical protein
MDQKPQLPVQHGGLSTQAHDCRIAVRDNAGQERPAEPASYRMHYRVDVIDRQKRRSGAILLYGALYPCSVWEMRHRFIGDDPSLVTSPLAGGAINRESQIRDPPGDHSLLPVGPCQAEGNIGLSFREAQVSRLGDELKP